MDAGKMTGAQIIAAVFILLVIGYLSALAVIFVWFSKAIDEDWEDGDPGPKWGKENDKRRD
jgi:hypothetical protein